MGFLLGIPFGIPFRVPFGVPFRVPFGLPVGLPFRVPLKGVPTKYPLVAQNPKSGFLLSRSSPGSAKSGTAHYYDFRYPGSPILLN